MEKLVKNSKKWMSALGVVAFLMVAGWQVGAGNSGTNDQHISIALEEATAGSAGTWYYEPDWCGLYERTWGCYEMVEKCRLVGVNNCPVSAQIPCEEACS